jgi:hypothetical protein
MMMEVISSDKERGREEIQRGDSERAEGLGGGVEWFYYICKNDEGWITFTMPYTLGEMVMDYGFGEIGKIESVWEVRGYSASRWNFFR